MGRYNFDNNKLQRLLEEDTHEDTHYVEYGQSTIIDIAKNDFLRDITSEPIDSEGLHTNYFLLMAFHTYQPHRISAEKMITQLTALCLPNKHVPSCNLLEKAIMKGVSSLTMTILLLQIISLQ